MTDSITSSEVVKSEGGTGGVIMMLLPMVVYIHGTGAQGERFGSISKERSKGMAPLSHATKCGFSVSILEVGRMYPVVAITCCNPSAHPSRIKL